MRFKDLTSSEQSKVRFLWRSQLRSIDAQPFRHIAQALRADSLDGIDEQALVVEMREALRQLDLALRRDFDLEPWMAHVVEHDRRRYLATAEEFGGLPGDETERSALTRRIHHQRIELRYLQGLMVSGWKWRATNWASWDDWWKREQGWTDESEAACSDVGLLCARLRVQRRLLRSAQRVIDRQQEELSAMLQRSIERAATG